MRQLRQDEIYARNRTVAHGKAVDAGGGPYRGRPVGARGGAEAIRPTATSHAEPEGTILSIDPLAKAIGVSAEESGGQDMVLPVIDHTKIQVEGRPSLFTDLRAGDLIRASYDSRFGRLDGVRIWAPTRPAARILEVATRGSGQTMVCVSIPSTSLTGPREGSCGSPLIALVVRRVAGRLAKENST